MSSIEQEDPQNSKRKTEIVDEIHLNSIPFHTNLHPWVHPLALCTDLGYRGGFVNASKTQKTVNGFGTKWT